MINRDRMVKEFIELVGIDSVTFHERQMADVLTYKLESMGLSVYEDNTGEIIGGDAGNLLCTVKGQKEIPAILLMAHMDTVVPGTGKKPVIDGNIIKTDGSTVLGGDDAAGIECILEALKVLKENNIRHGDIQIAFTVAEEGGLLGAKNMDFSTIYAKYAFVMDDGGAIGSVAVKAPSQNKIDVVVKGKSAHAGVEPEKGISAIEITSKAISKMRLGRIDNETTANIGVINGGMATNIVCDRVEIKAEARSRDEKKLKLQTEHMKRCFENAAQEYGGGIEFKWELMYPSYHIKNDETIIKILNKASTAAGVELIPGCTGGGSDTNILNGKEIIAVNVSVGMDKPHSCEEQICIDDMVKAAEFLVEIIKAVE